MKRKSREERKRERIRAKRHRHGHESTATVSKYARKLQRKGSGGTIDPRWMWWFVRGADTSAERPEG